MRRQKLTPELAEEIAPQKHFDDRSDWRRQDRDAAARLARLAQSPFIKVEASKFTEVGYVRP